MKQSVYHLRDHNTPHQLTEEEDVAERAAFEVPADATVTRTITKAPDGAGYIHRTTWEWDA